MKVKRIGFGGALKDTLEKQSVEGGLGNTQAGKISNSLLLCINTPWKEPLGIRSMEGIERGRMENGRFPGAQWSIRLADEARIRCGPAGNCDFGRLTAHRSIIVRERPKQ